MTKKKVLTIGGATQDIYLSYQGADCMEIVEKGGPRRYMLFESGAKVEVDDILYFTGGGATNSAVSFKRLGFDVSCCCMLGDDIAGKMVLNDLKTEGVDTSSIVVSPDHASGTSFVINSLSKDRTIFAYRGANSYLSKIPFSLISRLIDNIDQLYITSLSNESAKNLDKIVSYAKKKNIPVAINPGVSQLSVGAKELLKSLKNIDILILNSSEARIFMGALVAASKQYKKAFETKEKPRKCDDKEEACLLKVPLLYDNLYFSITNFFKEVLTMGPQIVVVTDGALGVYVATKDKVLFHPSLEVEVVDSLGAGDAFGSCFVGCLCQGMDIEDALRRGIANSASVIGKMGAKPGLLSHKELEASVKKMKSSRVRVFESIH